MWDIYKFRHIDSSISKLLILLYRFKLYNSDRVPRLRNVKELYQRLLELEAKQTQLPIGRQNKLLPETNF